MVAGRLANMSEGRPKNTVEISTMSQTYAAELPSFLSMCF